VPLARLLQAIASFRREGASIRAWSVYGAETRRLTLGTRDRETGGPHAPLHLAESFGARFLLVWNDGLVSAGEIDRSEIGDGVEAALARARGAAYDDPDAAQVLGPQAMPEVALHDPGAARIASGETGPLAARLARIRERVDARGFRTWSGSMGASESRARIVTSAGLDAAVAATSWGWSASFDGELADGFRGRAEEPLHDFDARLRRLEDLVTRLGRPGERAPSGLRTVILHPHVVESFVLALLLENLDGASVAHGESHFRASQFRSDDPVLREDLTLRVDPLDPLKAGSYRFTTEGVPATACAYVERGNLVTPVLNLKYARRLGLRPTATPHEYDTLHLEGPDPLPLEDAILEADGGAVVLHVLGVHAQDATSGDFSLSAPQALAIEKGRLGGRVRATLSGNLFAALRSEALRLVRFEGHTTPGLMVECRLS
jgi:PmbA protein